MSHLPDSGRWSRVLVVLLSPRTIILAFAVFLVLTVLRRPYIEDVDSQARLTTYSADPYGARGLFDVLQGLGWRVTRHTTSLTTPLDTNVIYAILAPPIPLTRSESHQVLSAVRGGAGLLLVPSRGSPLDDSLNLGLSAPGWYRIVEWNEDAGTSVPGDTSRDTRLGAREALAGMLRVVPSECEEGVFEQPYGTRFLGRYLEQRGPLPGESESFLHVRLGGMEDRRHPAVMGFRMGAGRVIVVADAALLRNDVLRLCNRPAGLMAVRLVEWLGGPGATVIFSEYHQGAGRHPSVRRAVTTVLGRTPPGRTLLQALIAGIILLVAAGVRPIRPRQRSRIERRSPLEHVGALARAYEQVEATRTVTRRLVRGLRRRHAVGTAPGMTDEQFLQAIAARHPEAAADVSLLLEAERRQLSPEELLRVGDAVDSLDRMLTR